VPADLPDLVLTPGLAALILVELGILLTGVALLFQRRADLAARLAGLSLVRLAPAPYPVADLLLGVVFTITGGLLAQSITVHFARAWFPPAEDGTPGLFEVVAGAGLQLGLLAGAAAMWLYLRAGRASRPPSVPCDPPPHGAARAVAAGARAFVMLLPVVWLSSFLWKTLLDALGVQAPPQDLVLIFIRTGDQGALIAMVFFAVIIAPLTEELIFRVGLFRWLRTRVPRLVALLLPAVVFSLLHFSLAALLPLAVLAVGFSVAYERGGHPLTPITAHALFNLNTLVLLLVGFPG
jgi:membrane protease YdiL (CAAX protease family)